MQPIRIAHISDTHIGYEAYKTVSTRGENQRGEDFARVFHQACADIIASDPPLVVHSGDVAEKPRIPIRYMKLIQLELAALASIRPDGTRRQVVVIAGNHDLPAHRREPCFLELFSDIPGVHIVTDGLQEIEFTDEDAPSELSKVRVTAMPHDTLKELALEERFDEVQPNPRKLNILVAHGVAGGSKLYRRTVGREYAVPTEVLGRGWDYVALGHWHKQGPVSLSSTADEVDNSPAWYAGSTENSGFGDVHDAGAGRGWLEVIVSAGDLPDVTRHIVKGRTMFRLADLDGAGMTPDQIGEALVARVAKAKKANTLAGSVVGQVVRNVPREIWALVDSGPARQLAASSMHYEISVDPVKRDNVDVLLGNGDQPDAIGGYESLLSTMHDISGAVLGDVDEERVSEVIALAAEALATEMRISVEDDK